MEIIDIAKKAAAALTEKKAQEVVIIDIHDISTIADYFVIASGTNQNQLAAMRDAVDEALYKEGIHAKNIEGNNSSTWILMDYKDVIVHLFSKEDRAFYDLEKIWSDGRRVEIADEEQK